jgi:hypothetical protein
VDPNQIIPDGLTPQLTIAGAQSGATVLLVECTMFLASLQKLQSHESV